MWIAWPANCCNTFEHSRVHHREHGDWAEKFIVNSCLAHSILILRPVVQQSELETLCECFPHVFVQFPGHLNHNVRFLKAHGLPHPLTVDGRQRLQHFTWPTLPSLFRSLFVQRIREQLFEVLVDTVCAAL